MKKQIWFTHIPKNTGSSIIQIFDNKYCFLNGSRSYVFHILYNIFEEQKDLYTHFIQEKYLEKLRYNKGINNFMQNDEIQPNRMNFWHVPLSFWKPHLLKHIQEKNIIFCVIRNPYERIVSDLFFFNLIDNTTLKKHVYRILKKYVDSNNYDNHNIPQYSFLIDDSNKINKDIIVFKTETLTNDLIKYGFTDFNKNENVNNIKNVNYFEFLNKKSINLINNFYKKDFELFDYPFITK